MSGNAGQGTGRGRQPGMGWRACACARFGLFAQIGMIGPGDAPAPPWHRLGKSGTQDRLHRGGCEGTELSGGVEYALSGALDQQSVGDRRGRLKGAKDIVAAAAGHQRSGAIFARDNLYLAHRFLFEQAARRRGEAASCRAERMDFAHLPPGFDQRPADMVRYLGGIGALVADRVAGVEGEQIDTWRASVAARIELSSPPDRSRTERPQWPVSVATLFVTARAIFSTCSSRVRRWSGSVNAQGDQSGATRTPVMLDCSL